MVDLADNEDEEKKKVIYEEEDENENITPDGKNSKYRQKFKDSKSQETSPTNILDDKKPVVIDIKVGKKREISSNTRNKSEPLWKSIWKQNSI